MPHESAGAARERVETCERVQRGRFAAGRNAKHRPLIASAAGDGDAEQIAHFIDE
jgi:hypothetical protein